PLTVDGGGFSGAGNTLNITGTPGPDTVAVTSSQVSTQVGASPVTISYSDIQALNLNSVPANQGGNDTFNVTSTTAATTIDGGTGHAALNVSATVAPDGSPVLNAPLTFVGGSGDTRINVSDNGSGDTIVMANEPVQAGQAVAAVVGAGLQLQYSAPLAAAP